MTKVGGVHAHNWYTNDITTVDHNGEGCLAARISMPSSRCRHGGSSAWTIYLEHCNVQFSTILRLMKRHAVDTLYYPDVIMC